ncbi:hypothetical protein Ct61P_09897 [Colletotrichum tofieldiae]|nr:hypothetical protein Ct61P_09897 [Colletotrichum tofieldiae]
MSYRQNSDGLDPSVAFYDQASNSFIEPVPVSAAESSPLPQPQPQPNSPAQADEDDDGSRSDAGSGFLARPLEIEEHESYLEEEVRIELDAQQHEADWRRRPKTEPPNPEPQQTPPQPPPLIIGAPLGRNLTAIEAATRLVSQWEGIHQSTLQSTPGAASPILEELTRARTQLAALTAEQQQRFSTSPLAGGSQNSIATPLNSLDAHKSAAIASRIRFLADSLEDSHFPPERANISAAISLYRTARVPYSANWAFSTPATSSTSPRPTPPSPPTAPPASTATPASTAKDGSGGTFLPENDTSYDMGHYSVTMSFRRMKSLVYRGALVTNTSRKRKPDLLSRSSDDEGVMSDEEQWPARFPDGDPDASGSSPSADSPGLPPSAHDADVKPATHLRRNRPSRHPLMARDPAAPTLHFRLLLDSGATLPLIYDRDVRALGIRRKTYAAVSRVNVETATDQMATWLYEMQVSVVDTQTCEPLVSSTSPVWPAEEHALGGVTLVMTRPSPKLDGTASFSSPCGGMDAVAKTVDGETTFLEEAKHLIDLAEGRDYGRLSGLLPFKACYVQATPGLRTMWMGEDRRDVLGAQRMPGQMRWAPGTGRVCDPGHPRDLWKTVCRDNNGRPALLRMAHGETALVGGEQGARMVDVEEKDWKGRSEVLVVDRNGTRKKHIIEPRSLDQQQSKSQHAKKQKM